MTEILDHFGHNIKGANLSGSGMSGNRILFTKFTMNSYTKEIKEYARY